ncbi:MAG: CBS domain-containing protein [Pirellulaceae bacterium]
MSDERRTSDPDDVDDPLENYEPGEYDDPLEQALVEEELGAIRHEPFATIPPETTVREALDKLAGMHIACLLVAENDRLLGVFSERDVLSKVALEFDQLKDQPVSDVMTSDTIYVYETDSAVAALTVMSLCGYRHVPVLDLNDNLVGIVSPQRVTEFLQTQFQAE